VFHEKNPHMAPFPSCPISNFPQLTFSRSALGRPAGTYNSVSMPCVPDKFTPSYSIGSTVNFHTVTSIPPSTPSATAQSSTSVATHDGIRIWQQRRTSARQDARFPRPAMRAAPQDLLIRFHGEYSLDPPKAKPIEPCANAAQHLLHLLAALG
jgi:hypothetical protein